MNIFSIFFQMTHPRYHVDVKEGKLTIQDIRLSDEGNYACHINTTGHPVIASTNAHLYVTSEYKI